jgi:uncharacterized protein YkwD
MSRVRTIALLAVLASLFALPAVASANHTTIQMLQRVNVVRKHHGLPKLHLSRSLQHSAGRYARHQMRAGYFGHSGRIHASSRYRTLGEILAMHWSLKAAVGHSLSQWMHSPPHRSIILSRMFRYAGAGYASGRFHGRRSTIWVMHFGKR